MEAVAVMSIPSMVGSLLYGVIDCPEETLNYFFSEAFSSTSFLIASNSFLGIFSSFSR